MWSCQHKRHFSTKLCLKHHADKKSWGYQSNMEVWSLLIARGWWGRCRFHLPHALWWRLLASLGAYMLPTHRAGLNYARNLFNCLTWFKASREIQVIVSSSRNFLQNGWGDSKIRNIATLGSFLKCIYFYFLPETNVLLAKSVPEMMKSKRRQGAQCTRK